MDIRLRRMWYTEKSTSGMLIIDGVTECFTLEDVARPDGVKLDGITCIQPGEYIVTIDFSDRFQKDMPRLINVPFFSGIRIHAGNVAADTHGCILVGTDRGHDAVWSSRIAFEKVFAKIKAAFDRQEPICLTVTNEPL